MIKTERETRRKVTVCKAMRKTTPARKTMSKTARKIMIETARKTVCTLTTHKTTYAMPETMHTHTS